MTPEIFEACILYFGIVSTNSLQNKQKIIDFRKEINNYLTPKDKRQEGKFFFRLIILIHLF